YLNRHRQWQTRRYHSLWSYTGARFQTVSLVSVGSPRLRAIGYPPPFYSRRCSVAWSALHPENVCYRIAALPRSTARQPNLPASTAFSFYLYLKSWQSILYIINRN